MTIVNRLHVLVDVGNDRWGGCNSALNLGIASGGRDVFSGTWTGANQLGNGHTVPANRTGAALVPRDTENRRLKARLNVYPAPFGMRGDPWQAISYESPADEDYYEAALDTASLEPSSIRLTNTGADLLRPGQILVWGMADLRLVNYPEAPGTVKTPVPLAAASDLGVILSNTFAEGPSSMVLPRTPPWRRNDGAVRRADKILLTIRLGPSSNAATPAPVTFRVVDTDGGIRCSETLAMFNELGSGEWKSWVLPVATPFTWNEIFPRNAAQSPCSLIVSGMNAAQLTYIYAFGIDSTTTPNAYLPLVHLEDRDPDGSWIGGNPADREKFLSMANHDVSEAG
jgi:hypothetical protein